MFTYFFYNLHPLFHMKVFEIPFSNSRLFSYTDDSLLQETPAKLRVHGCGRRRTHRTTLASQGAAITAHHAVKMLAGAEGLGHALRR